VVPGRMGGVDDQKALLHGYLRQVRDDLISKLDGVSERDARLPRTPTGNSLLGVVKHCLNVEAGYFGPTFGRGFPTPHELVALDLFAQDPQADWYARSDETTAGLTDLYRRVGQFADETIEQLPLDASGRVPWWPPDTSVVTLQQIIVHVTADVARHAGQADVMRERVDGAAGLRPGDPNLPTGFDWPAYVSKLTDLAERFPADTG
jgi:uncharacterized damage-inducible protein DinB